MRRSRTLFVNSSQKFPNLCDEEWVFLIVAFSQLKSNQSGNIRNDSFFCFKKLIESINWTYITYYTYQTKQFKLKWWWNIFIRRIIFPKRKSGIVHLFNKLIKSISSLIHLLYLSDKKISTKIWPQKWKVKA